MKKILIGMSVIAAGILLLWVWTQLEPSRSLNTQHRVQFPTGFSAATSTANMGASINISTASGTLAVRDFLADPNTKEDPANKGYYYVGNQPAAPTAYIIEYIAGTQYFNISLLQEPIGQARAEAESYLSEQLGIPKDQMCTLNYMVSTPDSVNSTYSDENLGFSFCPGAVQLPN